MALKKISELPTVASAGSADVFAAARGGTATIGVTAAQIAALAAGGGGVADQGVRVRRIANQSIPHDTTTKIDFTDEYYDTGGYHSIVTDRTRLTAPATGTYIIGFHLRFAAAANGERYATVLRNGSVNLIEDMKRGDATYAVRLQGVTEYELSAGDYVEIAVYQDSGGAVNVEADGPQTPIFWMRRTA